MDKRLPFEEELVNQTTVTEFVMAGLTSDPSLQIVLFIVLFPVFLFTLLGNVSILVIIWFNANLHTPMYFFLTQLSILDIIVSCDVSIYMLVQLLKEKNTISFNGCIVQMLIFCGCESTDFFLLSSMAFDRYVAICNPLQYSLILTKGLCVQLVVGSYIGGFINSFINTGFLFRLHFCGPNILNDYVCDYPVILDLSCTDHFLNDLIRFVFGTVILIFSFFIIIPSYFYIVKAILRIRTTDGRLRAASTCISHFTCLFLFYSSGFFMEVTPNATSSGVLYKVASVIVTAIIPALNPLIYSLRNNEVKEGLRKVLQWATECH